MGENDASEYLWSVYYALRSGEFLVSHAVEYECLSAQMWSECDRATPMIAILECADRRRAAAIVAEFARAELSRGKFKHADEYRRILAGIEEDRGPEARQRDIDWLRSVDLGDGAPGYWFARAMFGILGAPYGRVSERRVNEGLEDLRLAHVYAESGLDLSNVDTLLAEYEAELADKIRNVAESPPAVRDLVPRRY